MVRGAFLAPRTTCLVGALQANRTVRSPRRPIQRCRLVYGFTAALHHLPSAAALEGLALAMLLSSIPAIPWRMPTLARAARLGTLRQPRSETMILID